MCAAVESGDSAGAGRINVLWILLDACRADHLSCYGYGRATSPNIDDLAASGVLFERHYAQGPNTLLSVPTYMTGRFAPVSYQDPRHQELWFLRSPPEDEQLISSIFSRNGYATAMFSASPWYTEKSRLGGSFDAFGWLAHGRTVSGDTYRERNPELFGWLESHSEEPFFLYVHSLDTHEPRFENNTKSTWLSPSFPKERDGKLRKWRGNSFSERDRRHIVGLYDGGVAYADETVGELVGALDELGIRENTLVVVSSDHGEALAADGKTLGHPGDLSSDDLLQTPLVMSGPVLERGVRVQATTQNADIVPTLVELLGLESDARFDGRSLLPVLGGGEEELHEYAFARTAAFLTTTEPNRILIYDDVKFDFSPYNAEEQKFLGLPRRPEMLAWAMPDFVGGRKRVAPSPGLQSSAQATLSTRLEPLWAQCDALEVAVPPFFIVRHLHALAKDAITTAEDSRDNRWMRKRNDLAMSVFNRETLFGYAMEEDLPMLVFGAKVPDGTYEVSAYSRTFHYKNRPHGSSFDFLVEGEPEFRRYELDAPTGAKPNEKWFDLGTYTVSGGRFVYFIQAGDPNDLAVVGNFRFERVGATVELPSEEDMRAEMERLEALGYLE